jgi:hypothetical protein
MGRPVLRGGRGLSVSLRVRGALPEGAREIRLTDNMIDTITGIALKDFNMPDWIRKDYIEPDKLKITSVLGFGGNPNRIQPGTKVSELLDAIRADVKFLKVEAKNGMPPTGGGGGHFHETRGASPEQRYRREHADSARQMEAFGREVAEYVRMHHEVRKIEAAYS